MALPAHRSWVEAARKTCGEERRPGMLVCLVELVDTGLSEVLLVSVTWKRVERCRCRLCRAEDENGSAWDGYKRRRRSRWIEGKCRCRSVWETPFSAHLRRSTPDGRPLPRPEGPRQSLRSGSRSDSFWGSGPGGCTEMHYSPQDLAEKGTRARPPFPLASPPLPFFFPSSPFSPRPGVPGGGVSWPGSWPTIGYLFTLLLTMISHSPSTP